MIRLTRDLYVAEEKILAAQVHNTTVSVQYADGTPAGRTVEVPPFKDRDAAERWVANGFSDRPESDFEEQRAPLQSPVEDVDVPVNAGHPITAAQVRERNEDVDDKTAQKIAAAVGVPAGMMPALTPELAEIRKQELEEDAEIQRNADRVVAEERVTYPTVAEPRIPTGMTGSDMGSADPKDVASTGDRIVEDKVGPSAATVAPVSASDPDGSRFNAELEQLNEDRDEDEPTLVPVLSEPSTPTEADVVTPEPDFADDARTEQDPAAEHTTATTVTETYPAPDAGADMPSPEPTAYGDTPVTDPTPEPVADPVEPVTDPTPMAEPVVDPVATPHEVTPMESAAQPGFGGIEGTAQTDRRDDVTPA